MATAGLADPLFPVRGNRQAPQPRFALPTRSVAQDGSPGPRASPDTCDFLQYLEKLPQVLLLVLVVFSCAPAHSSLSPEVCQSFKKQDFFFRDKGRFLADSSSIPLNSQAAGNSANTPLPSPCFLTLIHKRSVIDVYTNHTLGLCQAGPSELSCHTNSFKFYCNQNRKQQLYAFSTSHPNTACCTRPGSTHFFFLDIIFPSIIRISKLLLKNVEVHLIEWTAKCSDIQEQSATSDKSVTSWPFADISKLASTT